MPELTRATMFCASFRYAALKSSSRAYAASASETPGCSPSRHGAFPFMARMASISVFARSSDALSADSRNATPAPEAP